MFLAEYTINPLSLNINPGLLFPNLAQEFQMVTCLLRTMKE
jgi:hypothetical protein